MVVWLVGLSGAGKTSIATVLLELWRRRRPNVVLLDGPALRAAVDGPDPELAFDLAARTRREQRIAELCALLDTQGLDVICALNSVDQSVRDRNRTRLAHYFEVFVATPVDVCLVRDRGELYMRALRGQCTDVLGMDLPADSPRSPDMIVDNGHPSADPAAHARRIMAGAFQKLASRSSEPAALQREAHA